jgi:hypothetical protein
MKRLMLVVLLMVLVLPVEGMGQEPVTLIGEGRRFVSLERDTLAGLRSICVFVKLDEEARAAGLHESMIVTDAELALRSAGIRVLSQPASQWFPLFPLLYIYIQTLRHDGMLAYSARVDLRQPVVAPGTRSISFVGMSWEKFALGLTPRSDAQAIRGLVKDFVAAFVNDYLAANTEAR